MLVPVLVNAFKTYRNASDADTRLKSLETWQQSQDVKLQAIQKDQERGFKDQGEHRYKLDKHLAVLEDRLADTKRTGGSHPQQVGVQLPAPRHGPDTTPYRGPQDP